MVPGAALAEYAFAQVENCPALLLDAVKMAEDSDSVVLRFYESFGGAQLGCRVRLAQAVESVTIVNLLEEPIDDKEYDLHLSEDQRSFTLSLAPFQIVTVLVTLKA